MLLKEVEIFYDDEEGSNLFAQRKMDYQEYKQDEYHDPLYMNNEEKFVEEMEQEVENSNIQKVQKQDNSTGQCNWESDWNYQTGLVSSESDFPFDERELFGSDERNTGDNEKEFGFNKNEKSSLESDLGSGENTMNNVHVEAQFGPGDFEFNSREGESGFDEIEFGSGESEISSDENDFDSGKIELLYNKRPTSYVESNFGLDETKIDSSKRYFSYIKNYFGSVENEVGSFDDDFVKVENDFGSGASDFYSSESEYCFGENDLISGELTVGKGGGMLEGDYSDLVEVLQAIEGKLETILRYIDTDSCHKHDGNIMKEKHIIISEDLLTANAQKIYITHTTKHEDKKDLIILKEGNELKNSIEDIIGHTKIYHMKQNLIQDLIISHTTVPNNNEKNKETNNFFGTK